MRKQPVKVGISGALSVARTPHARTLLRAISAALNYIPGTDRLALMFADDEAMPEKALSIARTFVDQGVDVVVGPFASDCLCAAAAAYNDARIPLVVPAATIRLPQDLGNCFYMCPGDDLIAHHIADRASERQFSKVALDADKHPHSARLREAIFWNLARRRIKVVETTSADAAIYAGRLATARAWLKGLRKSGAAIPALLTDDAAAEELLHDINDAGDIEVFGFPVARQIPEALIWDARHRAQYGTTTPIYFLEVVGAMAIVAQAAQSDRPLAESLREDTFSTPFGVTRFEAGERRSATCAIWRPDRHGTLSPQEALAVPPARDERERDKAFLFA